MDSEELNLLTQDGFRMTRTCNGLDSPDLTFAETAFQ